MNLIIHPGMAKTATSYVQKIFLNTEKILYLGKNYTEFYNQDLTQLHRRLFNPDEKLSDQQVNQLTNCYIQELTSIINQNSSENLVISEENILGYGIFNAKRNAELIARIFDELVKNSVIKPGKKTLLLTIREQSSLLQSHYAYAYWYWEQYARSKQELLRLLSEKPDWGAFERLWFFEITEMLNNIFPDFEINIVPYEILTEDYELYIDKVLAGLNVDKHSCRINSAEINKNSVSTKSGHVNLVRKPTMYTKIMLRLSPVKRLHYILKKTGVLNLIPEDKRKNMARILKPVSRYSSSGEIQFDEAERLKIHQIFRNSNLKLNEKYSLDLDKYGYC